MTYNEDQEIEKNTTGNCIMLQTESICAIIELIIIVEFIWMVLNIIGSSS